MSEEQKIRAKIRESIESLYEDKDPCWDGHEMIGMKDKNGKEVPNCVPKNENIEEEFEEDSENNYNSNEKEIVGLDILNHFPFSALPEKREDSDWIKGVEGWGKVHLPSLDMADAMTQIVAKDDFTEREVQGPKMLHKFSGYIDNFKKKFGEEPIFVIEPSNPWSSKVKIVNPKFLEWREEGVQSKYNALKSLGRTNEHRELRDGIRNIFEAYWSDKQWDEYLTKDKASSSDKDKLKSQIESYINSKAGSNNLSVEVVMDMAHKMNPDVETYDLIDVIKSVLSEIERENDEIDPTIRNRANELYDRINQTFQMVNEIEIVDDEYDFAAEEREHWDKEYFSDELNDEFEDAEEESLNKDNS